MSSPNSPQSGGPYFGYPGAPPQSSGPYFCSGAPTTGVTGVQSITIGNYPTGGTFALQYGQFVTSPIPWTPTGSSTIGGQIVFTASDAVLEAAIASALQSLPGFGSTAVTVAAGTGSNGVGSYNITFAGPLANQAVQAISVQANNLTGNANAGTPATVVAAIVTAGVTGTMFGCQPGTIVTDATNLRRYVNVGTAAAPSWARTGPSYAVVPLAGTTATTGGAVASWAPPEGGTVYVLRSWLATSVKSTGAANLSVGVGATATTSAANLIAASAVGSATVLLDSFTSQIQAATAAESGLAPLVLSLSGTQAVTVTGNASTAGLVGTLFIEYFKP